MGRVAAFADGSDVLLSPAITVLEEDHPERRFVCCLCIHSCDVDEGLVSAPYSDQDAAAAARAMLMPAEATSSAHHHHRVPLDTARVQLAGERGRVHLVERHVGALYELDALVEDYLAKAWGTEVAAQRGRTARRGRKRRERSRGRGHADRWRSADMLRSACSRRRPAADGATASQPLQLRGGSESALGRRMALWGLEPGR